MAETTENAKQTLTQKLSSNLKRNVLATVNLTSAVTTAFRQQGQIAKTFVSTGNRNAISSDKLSTTFSTVGLSLAQTLENFQAMSKVGLNITSKGNRDLFARYTILGADTKGLSKIMALNEQTLGLSSQRSRDLGDSLIETAAANGFSSDVLVQAMNSLSQTFIRASAVYGKETSIALQEATRNLIGKYGAGNADLIKELTSKLFAGTAQSTKMASMLGLDISKLATKDTATAEALMEQAIQATGNRVGGAAGEGSSGFAVSRLLESMGVPVAVLALSNMGPLMGEAAVVNAEALAQQTLQLDLQSSLNTIMKDFTILVLPALNKAASWLVKIASFLTWNNGIIGKLLLWTIAMVTTIKTFQALSSVIQNTRFMKLMAYAKERNMTLRQIRLLQGRTRGSQMMGMMGGPWMIALGLAMGIGTAILTSSKDENETSKNILSEQEKQTAALSGKSANTRILGNISLGILQANILNEAILINAQEHLEKTMEIAESPSVVASSSNPEWETLTK